MKDVYDDGVKEPPKGSLEWAQLHSGAGAPAGQASGELPKTGETKTGTASEAAPSASRPAGVAVAATDTDRLKQDALGQIGVNRTNQDLKGYDDMIDYMTRELSRVRPETPEEQRKRERRERSKRTIAAISDGLSALGNLFFTTQYAPNMFHPGRPGLSETLRKNQERAKAEREANADRYLQYVLKLGDLRNGRARTLRELEAQQEQRKLAREKAQREQEEHDWNRVFQPLKFQEQKARAQTAESKSKTAKAEADHADAFYQAKVDTEQARGMERRAAAAANGRKNPKEFYAWDEHGNMFSFEFEDAAIAFAKQHGTYYMDERYAQTTTTTTVEPNLDRKGRLVAGNEEKVKSSTKETPVWYPGNPADRVPPSKLKSGVRREPDGDPSGEDMRPPYKRKADGKPSGGETVIPYRPESDR